MQVRGFDKEDWNTVSEDIMYKACLAKFRQNTRLANFLLDTREYRLVEAK